MHSSASVSKLHFLPATRFQRERGLLGWVSLEFGGWEFNVFTVRITRDGRVRLSYREHRDAQGRRHPIVRPRNDREREVLEQRIIDDLRQRGLIP